MLPRAAARLRGVFNWRDDLVADFAVRGVLGCVVDLLIVLVAWREALVDFCTLETALGVPLIDCFVGGLTLRRGVSVSFAESSEVEELSLMNSSSTSEPLTLSKASSRLGMVAALYLTA